MRNKIISRFLSVILAVGLSAAMFTTTAFAGGGDEEGEVIPTQPTGEVVSTPAPKPLTPEGNLSLVDDIDGEATAELPAITEGQVFRGCGRFRHRAFHVSPKPYTEVISCQRGEWKAPRKKGAG